MLQFALFALVAAALASPKPDPQVLTYSAGPAVVPAVGYASPYAPVAYSAPYAAVPGLPYAYSGYYFR